MADGEYTDDYQDDVLVDDADQDESVAPIRYEISSYGIDFDVKGLVDRLRDGKIFVPEFQRSFVWRLPDSSRFVESLILGLPVPGIFLARDPDSKKMLVIDGQQRLRTLQFFYDGVFNPVNSKTERVFRLTGVQTGFDGKTYRELGDSERQTIDDSVIHATIVKQDYPKNDDTSIYHVYERLNSGGRRLHPQEIRTAIYYGPLIDELKSLNETPSWRKLFGPTSPRLKDQEMILRFMAFYSWRENYERPMAEFLTRFTRMHRGKVVGQLADLFEATMNHVLECLGERAFRPERNFNAAVFDSVSTGLAARIARSNQIDAKAARKVYEELLVDADYLQSTSRSTADKAFVDKRLELSRSKFAAVP